MCIDKIIAKGKILAAHLLGASPKRVEFRDGKYFVKGKPKKALTWKQLAPEAYVAKNLPPNFEPGLEASSFFEPPNCTYPFGTHIVAVEVDRETGQSKIVKYVTVDDCGPQINPLLVEGQVQGGIAHSLGQALFEQTVYDENGQLLSGEFMDYAMPRAKDIPEYLMDSTVTPSPSNPMGIKGVGEAGTIGATPAIANAVVNALSPLGVRHLDLPLTPEKVWKAIRDREVTREESYKVRKLQWKLGIVWTAKQSDFEPLRTWRLTKRRENSARRCMQSAESCRILRSSNWQARSGERLFRSRTTSRKGMAVFIISIKSSLCSSPAVLGRS